MALAIFSTPVMTTDGFYELRTITLQTAQELLALHGRVNSAVEHQPTADILSSLLGVEVPVSRQNYEQQPHETALVFMLDRPLEGQILSREQVEEIGYTFKALTRTS